MEIEESTIIHVDPAEASGEGGSREEREEAGGGGSSDHVVLVVKGGADGMDGRLVCDGDLERSRPGVEGLGDGGREEEVERGSESGVQSPHRLERPFGQVCVCINHHLSDLVRVDLRCKRQTRLRPAGRSCHWEFG